MSFSLAFYPITHALVLAESMPGMGANLLWHPDNSQQGQFLPFFLRTRGEVGSIPDLTGCASRDVEKVNLFLRERGFDIQLNPVGPGGFAVASILDLLVKWQVPGEETEVLCINGRSYPAARLDKGVQFLHSPSHTHPIVCLATKSEDLVYLTRVDQVLSDPFEILEAIEDLKPSFLPSSYDGVLFPMVDLDQRVDVSWLVGLNTVGNDLAPAWISEALMQNRLKMNHLGARAKSAFAAGVMRGAFEPDLLINGPFLVWFKRPGFNLPLFAAHVTYDHFRNPGRFF